MIKPKDLLHELEQGEKIGEDIKKFLIRTNSPPGTTLYLSGYNIGTPYDTGGT